MAVLVAAAVASTSLSLLASPGSAGAQSAEDEADWIVRMWGTTVHKSTRIGTDPDTEFHSLSITRTEGQGKVLFDIAPDGSLVGAGDGVWLYSTDPTWHLEGSYDGVPFDCDPPVQGSGDGATISGTATETAFTFSLDIPNARESNEEMECSENFSALATESQDLRDSLLFCGEVRMALADEAQTSCKKSQIFFEDMSSPTQGRIKREITHDWFIDLRLRNQDQSPSPSPSGSIDPSPSPSPEPRPSPTDNPVPTKNARASLMILERHLRATGAVSLAGWGEEECVSSVPVRLQRRRRDGSWATVATITTDAAGLWSRTLGDRTGRYRALAPEVVKGQATCSQAASRVRRHGHRS